MKTIILLITLVLCNLSFGCVILPNGNYIPCETNTIEILMEKSIKEHLKQIGYYKALIENVKTNIEYNVKLAESRLNEAEVKYIESIKKFKTTLHNATSKSFKQKVYSDYIAKQKAHSDIVKQKTNSDYIAKQAVYSAIAEQAKQKVYSETVIAKQKAYSEMRTAEFEYEKARSECGMIYAIAKGKLTSFPVGKSPREIFKLVK